jgi:hypothetical protein
MAAPASQDRRRVEAQVRGDVEDRQENVVSAMMERAQTHRIEVA